MGWLFKLLTSGFLDRALDTVDRRIEAETDREKLRADIIREHVQHRPDWLRAGGVMLILVAGGGYIAHAWAVSIYSVLWCANCAYAQSWTIAALPAPHGEYQGWVIAACVGGVALLVGTRK